MVSDMIDDVSGDTVNNINTLNITIKCVRECMSVQMNAHVVQVRGETNRQGQEITAPSSSLLTCIRDLKDQVGVTRF
jgi:hypothetical protein